MKVAAIGHQDWCGLPHKLQLGFETVRHLARVVPLDSHPVNVGRVADYTAGISPSA